MSGFVFKTIRSLLLISSMGCSSDVLVTANVDGKVSKESETPDVDLTPLTSAQKFDLACKNALTKIVPERVMTGLNYICPAGKASAELLKAIQKPYKGEDFFPIISKVTDDGEGTTFIRSDFPVLTRLTPSALEGRVFLLNSLTLNTAGVTTISTIKAKIPAVDATYRECYESHMTINTELILGVSLDDIFELRGCVIRVSESPRALLYYRDVDSKIDKKDHAYVHIALYVEETASTTLAYFYNYVTVANMGFPEVAQPKGSAQAFGTLKEYYKLMHQ